MAVKDRSQLLTDNASVFGNGKNTRGDDEKTFNDNQLDSVVMKSGDTFEPDAIFEFDNGSKLREGAIDHGYGGGIARVCANEKADQWEDGFKYLISINGSANTVVYTENINNDNPEDTDDETLSYAVGSRWKNLVTGIEYICTQANEGDAIWQAQSGEYTSTLTPDATVISAATFRSFRYNRVGNICFFTLDMEATIEDNGGLGIESGDIEFTLPFAPNTTNRYQLTGAATFYLDVTDFANNVLIAFTQLSQSDGNGKLALSTTVGFTVTEAVRIEISGSFKIA